MSDIRELRMKLDHMACLSGMSYKNIGILYDITEHLDKIDVEGGFDRLRELAEAEREGKIRIGSDWTPCAEGLPKVKETVMATIAGGYGNDIMFAWYDGENWNDGYKNKIPVIAWQPLPEPYNPDRKEDADHIVDANKKVED